MKQALDPLFQLQMFAMAMRLIQKIGAPLSLVLAAVVCWRSTRIGRAMSMLIIAILGAFPWIIGAVSYGAVSLLLNKVGASSNPTIATTVEHFIEWGKQFLQNVWHLPLMMTPAFLLLLTLVAWRGRRSQDVIETLKVI